jgi:uncharacterized membrane protein (UPF0127 family)
MIPARGAALRGLALPRALPVVLALLACAGRPPEAPRPAPIPAPRVVVSTAAGARHAVTVELARSDAEHERGLMFRAELAEEAGMLFVFDQAAPRAFWMKNTLLPLDMLFIDDAGVVAGIVRDAEPRTLTPRSPGPQVEARFVLEVRGGWAARHGVEPGARVELENVPRF